MKILVTGANGQLGFDVLKEFEARKNEFDNFNEFIGVGREEMNLTDFAAVREYLLKTKPDIIIHCGAYTAVDMAESNKQLCYLTNWKATENIAKICKEIDARLMYISTEYVFSGKGDNFYEVDDETSPLNTYGDSKLKGENAIRNIMKKYFIVRISWVFGINGKNFIKTMLRLGKEKNEINVVCDQFGSPTYTEDLAGLLCDMVKTEKYGTYHATNEGVCSWAEFAQEIFKQAGIKTKINYITSAQYSAKAKRPFNSRLSKRSLDENGFKRLPDWKDALSRYLTNIGI